MLRAEPNRELSPTLAVEAPAGGRAASSSGEPAFEQLIYEEDGPVARITLNRPRRRNALSMKLSAELVGALELVQESQAVKVLVIQGASETFCSGDDITEMGSWGNANEIMRRVRVYQRMADRLVDLDKSRSQRLTASPLAVALR